MTTLVIDAGQSIVGVYCVDDGVYLAQEVLFILSVGFRVLELGC